MKAKELRQRLGELTQQARQILDDAEKAKRSALNADEQSRWDKINDDITALEETIRRVDAQEAREANQAQTANPHPELRGAELGTAPGSTAADGNRGGNAVAQEITARFEHLSPEQRARIERRSTVEYLTAFRSYLSGTPLRQVASESRALSADVDISGGTLVAPMQWVSELIKFLDNKLFIRGLATKQPLVTAQSLGVPTWDTDPADFDWTTELGTGSEDSTAATGRREFNPHAVAKRIKLSNKLLRISTIPVEALIRERLGYVLGVTQEKAFMTGSGANQPLGVFTASASGISTGRDVVTGSATAILADSLFDALYALKEQYQVNAHWIFHRDGIKQIRKLKDSQNQYLWQPGLSNGQPSTILEKPFHMSEYAPNTFTTGLYVGLVGDFSFYHIADALDMTIQRLVELYAETNQVGFIARMESDGMPVLEEAFSRLKTS